MKIISTFRPSEKIIKDIQGCFPDIQFNFYENIKEAETVLEDTEILLTYGEDLNENHIQKAKRLKWIMVMSAGMEKMPFNACREKDILVTNARGIHKIPMAEFTIGTMLQHAKKWRTLMENEEQEKWNRHIPMAELAGKNLLILGIGAIGGESARLAKAFRMNVTGINRSGGDNQFADYTDTFENLKEHLPVADYIVAVLPSTDETKHMLKEEHFELMKRTAVFINIGRGDLVEEEVLIKVLDKKLINHAFLDVFETEPLPNGHRFWKMDNVTVTPHLSSITKQYLPRSFDIFKHNLMAYIKKDGTYWNVIDLTRGY